MVAPHADRLRQGGTTTPPELRAGDVALLPVASPDDVVAFTLQYRGADVGRVEIRSATARSAELSWTLAPTAPDVRQLTPGLRLVVSYALRDLQVTRLETFVAPDDAQSLLLAARSGLRREGVVRQRGLSTGTRGDYVLLALVAGDPDPQSREGFNAMLNAGLPKKRIISHGLLHDEAGRILLCELTYKPEWDLPGGVIETGESPAAGVHREVLEELGIEVAPRGLLAVNWLPSWRGWDDACQFVFDLGVIPASRVREMTLQPTEILAVHWCDEAAVEERAAVATATVLRALRAGPESGSTVYTETGVRFFDQA